MHFSRLLSIVFLSFDLILVSALPMPGNQKLTVDTTVSYIDGKVIVNANSKKQTTRAKPPPSDLVSACHSPISLFYELIAARDRSN